MKKKDNIMNKLRSLREELSDIETKERKKENKKLIGKCFKYNNSYSCPENENDYWPVYSTVLDINEDGHPIVFCFETDKYGKFECETKVKYGSMTLGTECPSNEMMASWSRQYQELSKMFEKAWEAT